MLLEWSNESAATGGKIVKIDMDGALNVSLVFSSSFMRDSTPLMTLR